MPFGTDRVLLFDVAPWSGLGFGVPNFADRMNTLNDAIAGLVNEIGVAQLYIMLSTDARRNKPPGPNTVQRIAKLVMRVNAVLGGRQQAYNELRLEAGHAAVASEAFIIHPVPYFNSDILRNRWLREYNNLVMIALSNMMQHSDNDVPLTITKEFAVSAWSWFSRIKILLGTELLGIPLPAVKEDAFVFTDAHFAAYDPMKVVLEMEAADTPGPVMELPTDKDVQVLYKGYPATIIAPFLKQAPQAAGAPLAGAVAAGGAQTGLAGGAAGPEAAGAPAPSATAAAPLLTGAGNVIGAPTI